jgi:small subunit ribosomal protein S19
MRSLSKGLFVTRALAHDIVNLEKKKVLTVYSRASTILPCLIGQDCRVYNGHRFFFVTITPLHVGYKFGELSPTRKTFKPKIRVKVKKTIKKNVKGK